MDALVTAHRATPGANDGVPGNGLQWLLATGWGPYALFAILIAAPIALTIGQRELWFSDEIRYAAVLVEMRHSGDWLGLTLNGAPYPDKPPLYFWFLAAIAWAGGSTAPWVFFLGAALSGWLFVAAGYLLARRLLPDSPMTALAGGLGLIATPYVAALFQYSRMDLMFAALIGLAYLWFYEGCREERASLRVVLAFLAAMIATFTKGPLGIALPLLAVVVWLGFERRARRLLAWDFAAGLALALGVVGLWLAARAASEGWSQLLQALDQQVFQRAVSAWHHKEPVWHYVVVLPLIWLPWTFLLLLPSVRRRLSDGLRGLRRPALAIEPASPALRYLGLAFLSGFLLLTALSGKIHIYLLPLLAPLGIVTVHAYLRTTETERGRFWFAAAILYFLLAAAAGVEAVYRFSPEPVAGLPELALLLAFIASALQWARRKAPLSSLAIAVAGTTALVGYLGFAVLPSLDPMMSPKAQAERLKVYIAEGYDPIGYGLYSGLYTYYVGRPILEIDTQEALRAALAAPRPVALATSRRNYDRLQELLPGFAIVHEQRIAERVYVLAVRWRSPPPSIGQSRTQ